jgi:predicted 2-oxoglutarate/Fe(II)-dependent dioxygenase YbiX|tara:strand:+ start:317 stop:865 length:549 start_codon:yes stop_codon:yes gene_type:complete
MKNPKHGITGNFSIEEEDVKSFMEITERVEPNKGEVFKGSEMVVDKNYRDVDVYQIESEEESLYNVLQKVARTSNGYFNYDINGIEKAQVMKYTAPSNGYGWHIDIGADGIAAQRKIAVSILLNEDYAGGEMAFRTGERIDKIVPKTGEVVAFSSFISHCVRPITKGERYAVVAWFTGPHFK